MHDPGAASRRLAALRVGKVRRHLLFQQGDQFRLQEGVVVGDVQADDALALQLRTEEKAIRSVVVVPVDELPSAPKFLEAYSFNDVDAYLSGR